MQEYIYVANWKAYLSYNQIDTWLTTHSEQLQKLTEHATLVMCPPTSVLALAEHLLYETDVQLGAQNVSAYEGGAHTGEDTARSLKEIGCTLCIIGHSEQRASHGETNDIVAQKALLLIKNEILPILCIGESAQERKDGQTNTALSTQLNAVMRHLPQASRILIAYEPVWTIGSGITASHDQIQTAVTHIGSLMMTYETIQYGVLYGGSVSAKNIRSLKLIDNLDGFLIGGASTEYDELATIIKT